MSADTIGIVLSVLFGISSIYFYLRSRRVKCLACLVGTITVQKRSHPEIEIVFRGTQIANLSRMLVFLWNRGTTEIRSTDIPPDHQPLLSLHKEARILSIALLHSSGVHNQMRFDAVTPHQVQFTFDYLNPSDGGVVEILFDGGDSKVSVGFTAPIIGGAPAAFMEFERSRATTLWELIQFVPAILIGSFFPSAILSILLPNEFVGWAFLPTAAAILIIPPVWWCELNRLHRHLPRFAKSYFKEISSSP